MLGEDIYREFAVRTSETRIENDRTTFACHLVSWRNHHVSFELTLKGCVGEKHYQAQYNAISKYCKAGTLLVCSIVYRRRTDAFVMCINQMAAVKPIWTRTGNQIDAVTYFNPNRGFWAHTEPVSDWVNIPGVIELSGQSCIPLVEEDTLPLVEYQYGYDKGLQFGKRPNTAQLVWRWAFPT